MQLRLRHDVMRSAHARRSQPRRMQRIAKGDVMNLKGKTSESALLMMSKETICWREIRTDEGIVEITMIVIGYPCIGDPAHPSCRNPRNSWYA